MTLGEHWTLAFLKRFGLLCSSEDRFIHSARRRILDFRDEASVTDPVSRSIFHRAQCVWQLGIQGDGPVRRSRETRRRRSGGCWFKICWSEQRRGRRWEDYESV